VRRLAKTLAAAEATVLQRQLDFERPIAPDLPAGRGLGQEHFDGAWHVRSGKIRKSLRPHRFPAARGTKLTTPALQRFV
jgi:hypothetical protein